MQYLRQLHGEHKDLKAELSDAQAIVDSVMTGDNDFAKKILVKFAKLSDEHWKQLQEILTELENN